MPAQQQPDHSTESAAAHDAAAAPRPVRALIVIDGSERTGRVVECALTLASKGLSLEAILLGVVTGPPEGPRRGFGSFEREDIQAHFQDLMGSRAVAAVARRLDAAGIVHLDRIEVGEPAPTILRVAKEEACDLIVLADPPPGLMRRWLPSLTSLTVSTIASQVAQEAPLPVMMVK